MCTGRDGHDGDLGYHPQCYAVPDEFFLAAGDEDTAALPEFAFLGGAFRCDRCIFHDLHGRRARVNMDDHYVLALIRAAIIDGERGAYADSSRKQYAGGLGKATEFGHRFLGGRDWLPSARGPGVDGAEWWCAVFYEHLSRTSTKPGKNVGLAPPSIENVRAAITAACNARGANDHNPTHGRTPKLVLKGIKRRSQWVAKQAAPISLSLFVEITTRINAAGPDTTYVASCAYTALAVEFFAFFRGQDTESLAWSEISYEFCSEGCTQPNAGGCTCHIRIAQHGHKTDPFGLTAGQHEERSRVIIAMRPRCGVRLNRVFDRHRLRQQCMLPDGEWDESMPVIMQMPATPAQFDRSKRRTVVSSRNIVAKWRRHIAAAKADGVDELRHADVERYTRHSSKHGGNEAAKNVEGHCRASVLAHGWAARRDGKSGRRPTGDMTDYYDSIQDACNSKWRRLVVTLLI